MAYTRAERRSHRERLLRQRFREQLEKLTVKAESPYSPANQALVWGWAVRNVTAPQGCSSQCCHGVRKKYGNARYARTMQEYKADDRQQEKE